MLLGGVLVSGILLFFFLFFLFFLLLSFFSSLALPTLPVLKEDIHKGVGDIPRFLSEGAGTLLVLSTRLFSFSVGRFL